MQKNENMTGPLPEFEVYAIRYATMKRRKSHTFTLYDEHDGIVDMHFYVWLIKRGDQCVLVDTGFGERSVVARQRPLECCPIEALSHLGIKPDQIHDVILTHLHWDHAGNLGKLPVAKFHLQDEEAAFATGRCMCFPTLRRPFAVEDVCDFVHRLYEDRVVFHNGDDIVFPGIELLHVGGHTRGLQAVRVNTARGWVVLASDAAHYYDNVTLKNPFPVVVDVAQMLMGHKRLLTLAGSLDHFIPGHDPAVLDRYAKVPNIPVEIAILHEAPLAATAVTSNAGVNLS